MSLKLPLTPVKFYDKNEDKKQLPLLRKQYGYKKTIPKEIELQALRALAHYPELLEVPVIFRYKDMPIAHASRPGFKLLHGRTYEVVITTKLPKHLEKTLFKNLSYNAQIGVLSHELAHTSEYIRTNLLGIIEIGFHYIFNRTKKRYFENNTDMRAINHGAGWQLFAWSSHVHEYHVKDGRGNLYFSPKKIKQIIKDHPIYA